MKRPSVSPKVSGAFMISLSMDGQSFYLLEGNKVHGRHATMDEAINARQAIEDERAACVGSELIGSLLKYKKDLAA